jgi:hypothetical protein
LVKCGEWDSTRAKKYLILMKKALVKTCIVILAILAIPNLFPVLFLPFTVEIGRVYTFQTKLNEFTFEAIPSKGMGLPIMEKRFNSFLSENPMTSDTILYRTFKRDWSKFWKWRAYLNDEKYKYKYLPE